MVDADITSLYLDAQKQATTNDRRIQRAEAKVTELRQIVAHIADRGRGISTLNANWLDKKLAEIL